MKTRNILSAVALAVLALASGIGVGAAGAQPQQPVLPVPEPPEAPTYTVEQDVRAWGDDILRIGQDYVLQAGDTVDEVVVIIGNARIEGRALRDVTVILGDVDLGPSASVRSLTVVGGKTSFQPGAQIEHDLVIIGGTFDPPPSFRAGGEVVVFGPPLLGDRLQVVTPWITRGLLWGRPIVPGLGWIWPIVGLFFLLYLVVNAVFQRPVRAVARTVSQRPLTAFVAGMIVLILTGPIVFLLAVTLVGIPLVPVLFCALFVAGLLGKVGVMRATGMSVIPEDGADGVEGEASQIAALRSFVIGFAALVVVYMVPVLGLATMALVGVLGLGGSALSFMAAYRRENPAPPRVRQEPPSPPVQPPPLQSDARPDHLRPGYGGPPEPGAEAEGRAFTPVPAGGSTSMASSLPPPDSPSPAATPASTGGPAIVMTDLGMYPHAMFLDRLGAFVLDVLLVAFIWQIFWPLRRAFGPDGMFLTLLVYHIGFWTWKATTVGGIICQLRVVRTDGASLQFVDAFVRGLTAIFSLAIVGLGGLAILKDPERQAWHDRVAGTFVVKVPRNYPI